jgi:hypothetical protein
MRKGETRKLHCRARTECEGPFSSFSEVRHRLLYLVLVHSLATEGRAVGTGGTTDCGELM